MFAPALSLSRMPWSEGDYQGQWTNKEERTCILEITTLPDQLRTYSSYFSYLSKQFFIAILFWGLSLLASYLISLSTQACQNKL